MKINIPYYLRQVLREQRKVYVPGIGTFKLIQLPAQFSDNKSTISPPQLSLTFDEGNSDDNRLIKYISDTGLFSDKKIAKAVDGFTQESLDSLVNKNALDIDGLGFLSKVGNSLKFSPTLETLTREYSGFRKVKITPITRITETSEVAHVVDTNNLPAENDSSYSWWLQPLLAGVLIATFFVIGVKGCDYLEDKKALEAEINQAIDQNEIDLETKRGIGQEQEVSEDIEKKYGEVDQLIGTDGGNVATKVEEELSNLTPKGTATESDEKEELKEEVKSIVLEKEVEANTSVNKYADIIPASGECIIILGSFKRASNISRMMSIIERDGKSVYRSQFNGYTRVGYKFECTNVNIDEYLTDVRSRLSSKAWYLDPSINIPYR